MSKLVSIIMPMYNSKAYVLKAIQSIINQSYSNWELLVIDDCSTDNSLALVKAQSQNNSRIKLLENKINSGAAIARNKGIQASKGSYIAFLDADDMWLPQKLEFQINLLNSNKADVCFSSYDQIDSSGNKKNILVKALPVLTYKKLLKSNYIGNLTGIYNAEKLGKITILNLRKRQDWLLWLTVIKKSGRPAIGLQDSLALYRITPNSMSSNKFDLLKYNYWVYKKGLGFSTLHAILKTIIFLKEHFFIKSKQIIRY